MIVNRQWKVGLDMDRYKNWLHEDGKSPNTINRYMKIVSDFQQWYRTLTNNEFDPRMVTALDLQDWKQYLLHDATYQRSKDGDTSKYSISTVNNNIKGIKAYFTYLSEEGIISTNPANKLKAHKIQEDDEPRWLNRQERSRFLFYIDNSDLRKKNAWRFARNRAISFTMLHAGLRVSEVVDLEVEDLDFIEDILLVRDGKGGKSRYVPMNKDLSTALRDWLDVRGEVDTKKLFTSQRKGPLTTNGVDHIFRSLSVKVGIPDLTPHVLRHTFAHDLAERGESLRTIARLLGHSNINYTRRYVTPSRDEIRAAVNKLSGERY